MASLWHAIAKRQTLSVCEARKLARRLPATTVEAVKASTGNLADAYAVSATHHLDASDNLMMARETASESDTELNRRAVEIAKAAAAKAMAVNIEIFEELKAELTAIDTGV